MANILIVEDDPQIRKLFAIILQRDHQVWDAANADQADAIVSQHHFDLVIADVVLPGGRSGTDFVVSLIQATPGVRVLFVSGAPVHRWRKFDRENLARIRTFSVLNKPFLPSVLKEQVLKLLSDRQVRTA